MASPIMDYQQLLYRIQLEELLEPLPDPFTLQFQHQAQGENDETLELAMDGSFSSSGIQL